MKNIIYLIILVLFLSCQSKKAVIKSDTKQKVEQQTTIKDAESTQKKADLSVIEQSSTGTETVTETTKYDTSKPTDPVTGKPPIIEESKTTINKNGKRDVTTKVIAAVNKESTHNDDSKVNAIANERIKTIEKTKPVDLKLYIFALIFLIAGFLVFRYWSKIKLLFS